VIEHVAVIYLCVYVDELQVIVTVTKFSHHILGALDLYVHATKVPYLPTYIMTPHHNLQFSENYLYSTYLTLFLISKQLFIFTL
jgi:hypothetical protein